MSCNGCRVLRKGCSESCILRPCLQWIESPEAQGHATVFVAKFFGRAGLMSFISAVPENQRPALFQSLLFEACGRTVNPVNGAVGLLGSGNWQVCQAAVDTVLRGGSLRPMTDSAPLATTITTTSAPDSDEASDTRSGAATTSTKRKDIGNPDLAAFTAGFHSKRVASGLGGTSTHHRRQEKQRPPTPSMNSEEESVTTSSDSRDQQHTGEERKLLNLFV